MTHDAATSTVAVASYGRVGSGDPMDAAAALRRQADTGRRALPDDFHIVAWFCDAPTLPDLNAATCPTGKEDTDEPVGNQTGPADPGTGTAQPGTVGVRRDGGLVELLEAARRPEPA